jgi:hypothetical protein
MFIAVVVYRRFKPTVIEKQNPARKIRLRGFKISSEDLFGLLRWFKLFNTSGFTLTATQEEQT